MNWVVYMIYCSDDSLYTGITNNLERRVAQHSGQRGAKYFRGRMPGPVVYLEQGHTRSSASRREAAIKKLSAPAKRALILMAGNMQHSLNGKL
ncbi:MAG TPA: GIY-YIG nuclease family protein [Gammaproteobacteria bacterium]|nr:GIY-YIG nuclease family protein [Gammaproteobacteria bacterium]